MTLSPELLVSLAHVPFDWELLPLNGRKQPVDPFTGELLGQWGSQGSDLEGIKAIAHQPAVKAVGLLLGPQSGGVLAVDFDGEHAAAKFAAVFGRPFTDLPTTIAVTSGRPHRCGRFFTVDREHWPALRRRASWTGPDDATCLELRWDRHYQVIAGAHPITTGYRWVTSPSEIAVPAPAPDWLVQPLVRNERQLEPYQPAAGDGERAVAMLSAISPTDFESYDRWLEIGMALHSVDPGLLTAWVDWSRGMSNFDETECLAKWDSFKGGGITIATLCHHAKNYGFQPASAGGGGEPVGKMPDHPKGGDECVGKIPVSGWIVRDFVHRAALMVLGAEKGSGKTSLLYRLCQAISAGDLFLDQLPTSPARCLVIQGDEPESQAQAKFHRMGFTPAFELTFRDPAPLDLHWLEQLIASGRYDLIVIDSIGTLLTSSDLEVTDLAFSRVLYRLNKYLADHGVAGILTHHLNKPPDRQIRKQVTHHDFLGVSTLLAACSDAWSLCRITTNPLWEGHYDLRCHGKRFCRDGTLFNLQGHEEDFSWLLRSTGDGLLPQDHLLLEQRIRDHFLSNPDPLPLDHLAQSLGTSYEYVRRVSLALFDDKQLHRQQVKTGERGRPRYLYSLNP